LLAPGEPPLSLLVRSNPDGAEVSIDGKLAGVSPIEIALLEEGDHLLRVTKEGFLPFEERVTLTAGEPQEPIVLALQPAKITLFVESEPTGARVSVDGAAVGTTPLEDLELDPGQHEVQVERRGYDVWRSAVVAQAGETVNLTARLRSQAPAPVRTEAPKPAAREGDLVELGPDDKPAKRISGSAPSYPPMARKLGQQGRVTVQFILTEEGVPTELEILESAGDVLDRAVLESVAAWRYEPAEKGGVKVRVRMRVRQTFRLGSD
jgi:TonB family protein